MAFSVANFPVGVFGKLPNHADFVRINAGSPAARAWDEWISASLIEMRRAWGNSWETTFDQMPFFNALVRPISDQRAILACHLRPGRDQSGRRYPLSIFGEVQAARQGRGIQVLPHALEPFFRASSALASRNQVQDITGQEGIADLATWIPKSATDMSRPLADELKTVSMADFWSATMGAQEDPRKYLLIKNLFGMLAPVRGIAPPDMKMCLHFPGTRSPGVISESTTMAVWAMLVRAVVGDDTMANSWLFWNADSQAPQTGCQIFFRAPPATALTTLMDEAFQPDTVWDMATIGHERIDEARDALGPDITSALDSHRHSLLDFIQRI